MRKSRHIVLFFFFQIIIDCLHTVTIFPFLHYGMFSQVYTTREVNVFEIKANERILSGQDFGILTWDLIHSPLNSFKKQITTKDFSFDKKVIKKGIEKTGLKKPGLTASHNLDNSQHVIRDFPLWYKGFLAKLLHQTVNKLQVSILRYRYEDGNYILLDKVKWIDI